MSLIPQELRGPLVYPFGSFLPGLQLAAVLGKLRSFTQHQFSRPSQFVSINLVTHGLIDNDMRITVAGNVVYDRRFEDYSYGKHIYNLSFMAAMGDTVEVDVWDGGKEWNTAPWTATMTYPGGETLTASGGKTDGGPSRSNDSYIPNGSFLVPIIPLPRDFPVEIVTLFFVSSGTVRIGPLEYFNPQSAAIGVTRLREGEGRLYGVPVYGTGAETLRWLNAGLPWFGRAEAAARQGRWTRRRIWTNFARAIRYEAGLGTTRAVAVRETGRQVTTADFANAEFLAEDWELVDQSIEPPEIDVTDWIFSPISGTPFVVVRELGGGGTIPGVRRITLASLGPQDDDLRVDIAGRTVSDTRLNVQSYFGETVGGPGFNPQWNTVGFRGLTLLGQGQAGDRVDVYLCDVGGEARMSQVRVTVEWQDGRQQSWIAGQDRLWTPPGVRPWEPPGSPPLYFLNFSFVLAPPS